MAVLKRIANPAPLGLAAFGMTTILLNLHNAGFFGLGAMILAMGLFFTAALHRYLQEFLNSRMGTPLDCLPSRPMAFSGFHLFLLLLPLQWAGQKPLL